MTDFLVQLETKIEVLTIMVQQSPVFSFLAHVIQLNGFILASCGDESITG